MGAKKLKEILQDHLTVILESVAAVVIVAKRCEDVEEVDMIFPLRFRQLMKIKKEIINHLEHSPSLFSPFESGYPHENANDELVSPGRFQTRQNEQQGKSYHHTKSDVSENEFKAETPDIRYLRSIS